MDGRVVDDHRGQHDPPGLQLRRIEVRLIHRSKYEWGLWIYGLLSAFIGGGATALSTGTAVSMIDPEKFNVRTPGPLLLAMAITFVASGLTPFFAYLKNHPLPEIRTETETKTTSLQTNPPAIIEETVRTTETKPSQQ